MMAPAFPGKSSSSEPWHYLLIRSAMRLVSFQLAHANKGAGY